MTRPQRALIISLLLAALFIAALLGGLIAVFWFDLSPLEQNQLRPALNARWGLVGVFGLLGFVSLAFVVNMAVRHLWLTPARLLEAAQLAQHSNTAPATLLTPPTPGALGVLDQFIITLLTERIQSKSARDADIAAARQTAEDERNRLAALMSELTQSVLVCNAEGRILLYNERARALCQTFSSQGLVGLGRSVYNVLDERLIAHARTNLEARLQRGHPSPLAQFVTGNAQGQLLRVQMAPVRNWALEEAPSTSTGFVLMLENLSDTLRATHEHETEIQRRAEIARHTLATAHAHFQTLAPLAHGGEAARPQWVEIENAFKALQHDIDHIQTQLTQAHTNRWPLEDILGADLLIAAQNRIAAQTGRPTKVETVDETHWVRADSFSLLQALAYLANRLVDEFEVRELRLALSAHAENVSLDLIWQGHAMSTETVMNWEMEPIHMAGAASPLSVRDVIARHQATLSLGRDKTRHRAWFRLTLPIIDPHAGLAPPGKPFSERPEFYDFDLFAARAPLNSLADTSLTALTYTAFDTETSGLNPSAGDEIIQLGAVRIVNLKRLNSETFEQLIDPGFALQEDNIRIHGITNAALSGQPRIEAVLPRFHAFAADTVLVAHNAAFDLRFLQMKEAQTGLAFGQPVLDTLLLSAVLHPHQEQHSLEAIAHRLNLPFQAQHNALGDAKITADIFLQFIPLLAAQGITTLSQAQAAAERTYYARLRY